MKYHSIRFIISCICQPNHNNNLAAHSIRQALSGGVTTVVDIAIFKLGLCLGLDIFIAACVSYIFAVLTNFLISKYYVYSDGSKKRIGWGMQLFMYWLTTVISLLIIQLMLYVFVLRLGWPALLVKIMAVAPVFIWSVLSGRYLIFKKDVNNGQ